MREQGGARGIGPHNEVSDALTCSIASTLKVIGDKWTLLILRDAFRGVRRFDDFACDLGIARNLLTDRLAKLVEHGILARVPYQERPVVLVHDACGEPLDQVFVCWRCDETITPRQIKSRPGSGAAPASPPSTSVAPARAGRHVYV